MHIDVYFLLLECKFDRAEIFGTQYSLNERMHDYTSVKQNFRDKSLIIMHKVQRN